MTLETQQLLGSNVPEKSDEEKTYSPVIEFTMAGDKRRVALDDMTRAELELASIEGDELAKEELQARRDSL